ncbi:MAG: CDP-alcohol phosphatidyltransferase family protein [Thermodesulfovibrio sp.]|nr:CDP-alcohol phosphatidyltransferase family protein [Thermodesulfovibrio sp.]
MEKNKILTIPNLITTVRILMAPFFISAMMKNDYSLALKIVIFAGITDSLDGILARVFNQTSKLGVFLDPFADKLFLVSIMLVFYLKDIAPKWFLLIVFLRDIFVAFGWLEVYLKRNVMIKPTIIGKLSNASQIMIFAYILLSLNFNLPQPNFIFYLIVSGLSIISILQYAFIRFKDEQRIKNRKSSS